MDKPLTAVPSYRIGSVDNALRIAVMLQMEGALTVKEVANRLGVAGSTAHRLLQMLVYRNFAVQDDSRTYLAGPILELGPDSRSDTLRLRTAGLSHLHSVVDQLGESANLIVRIGATARFIACVESDQMLRVTSREGVAIPAHLTTAGLLMLAELPPEKVDALYEPEPGEGLDARKERPNLVKLHRELDLVRRRDGFTVNIDLAERGVVAVGVPVRGPSGEVVAGMAVSIPSIRYEKEHLPRIVNVLTSAAARLEIDLQAAVGAARPLTSDESQEPT